jgi:hypothetical protein
MAWPMACFSSEALPALAMPTLEPATAGFTTTG